MNVSGRMLRCNQVVCGFASSHLYHLSLSGKIYDVAQAYDGCTFTQIIHALHDKLYYIVTG